MSTNRIPPSEFVAKLRQFPDFVELRFNDALGRWEFVFQSAANVPTSQFLGWDKNPLTGERIEADPVTGLLPFRDLDLAAQQDILVNLEKTFIGNRTDGDGTWRRKAENARNFNRDKRKRHAKERGEEYAYLISQMDLRRPWVKYHQRSREKKYFPAAPSAPKEKVPAKILIVSK